VDDPFLVELLLTRSEAKRLADLLPPCDERRTLRDTILACDIMRATLQSETITQERVSEMREAYEGWKRSKHEQLQGVGHP
jgi:hypothetical protein